MTLPELYAQVREKGRPTPSVFARIKMLEDFADPSPDYCATVCQIPNSCKKPDNAALVNPRPNEVGGIVMVYHSKPKDWRDRKILETLSEYMATSTCRGIPFNILYTTRCQPDDNVKKDYSITQAKACKSFLEKDIDRLKPRVIIVASTMAAKAVGLVGVGQKTHLSRFLFPFDNPLVSVIMTISPLSTTMIRQNASGAFWGNDFFAIIKRDFEKANDLWHGRLEKKDPRVVIDDLKARKRIVVTRTLDQVEREVANILSLPANTIISWDTETTGLDPWADDARFLCHQFGYIHNGSVRAVVIPLWHKDNHGYDANLAWPYVVEVLQAAHLTKVGHNGKFDLKYTRVTTGVEVANYSFDTMYAIHSLCSGVQGTYSLKKAVWDVIPESGLGGYDDLLEFEEVEEDEDQDE